MRRLVPLVVAALSIAACNGPIRTDDAPPRVPQGVDEANARLRPVDRPLEVGDPAPIFALKDQNDVLVTSQELAGGGAALLIISPPPANGASRPVAAWAARHRQFLSQHQIEILIVTPATAREHRLFAAENNLRVALLSDPAGWVSAAWGVPTAGRGSAGPHSFLISGDGRVHLSAQGLPDPSEVVVAAQTLPGRPRDPFFRF
jgi:peroxiredoxin (alkyl hydroperoxide reductase subunit C)